MSLKMMTTPFHRSRVVGLQALLLADTAASLLQISGHHHDQHHTNHVITKSLTSLLPPPLPSSSSSSNSTSPHEDHLLLLQSCQFCSTKLSPKEEVYMYRGDQGFCSRKCRDKQVKLDEIKEAEESNLIFHLNHSYNSSRRRRQLKAAPLLEICSSGSSTSGSKSSTNYSSTASHRQGDGCSRSIPRRHRPVPQYYNRPLPLPPHQRLGYMNHRRQLAR